VTHSASSSTSRAPREPGPAARRAIGATCLLLLVFFGCSTDDSGGLDDSCLAFVPSQQRTDGEVTAVLAADSSCDLAILELVVTGVSDVWSVQFELDYPIALSQFAFIDTASSFLVDDGTPPLFHAEDNPLGHLVVGVSRQNTGSNTGVTPTEDDNVLVRLGFVRFANSGEGLLMFMNPSLSTLTVAGEQPTELLVPFHAGSFVIEN